MEPISFSCSSCHQAYRVGLDKAGKRTKCFKCGAALTIPEAPAPTPAAQTTRPSQKEIPTAKHAPVEAQETESYPEVAHVEPAPKAPPRRRAPKAEDAEEPEVASTKTGPRRRPKPAAEEEDTEDDRATRRKRAEEEDDTEDDKATRRRKRARGRAANWRKVRLGLLLMLIAVCAGVVMSLILNLYIRISMSSPAGIFSGLQSFLSWMRIFQFGTLVQTVVAIAGYCLCLFVPREHYCRKLAITVLVVATLDLLVQTVFDPLNLSSMGLLGDFFGKLMEDVEKGDLSGFQRLSVNLSTWAARMAWFGLFIQILSYAKVLLVPIFLWSLARCLRSGLTHNVETLLKISLGIVALGIFTQLLFRLPLTVVMHVMTPLSWVSMLLGLAQTIWTLLILINVRQAITDKLND
jgi:hypothetical protein